MITEAIEALKEAREAVQAWADYVPEYFQQKHDLAGDLARIDAALASLEAEAKGEPVAWPSGIDIADEIDELLPSSMGYSTRAAVEVWWRDLVDRKLKKLATHPHHSTEEARDAARYRHMRNNAAFRDRNGPGLYWYLPRFSQGDPADRLDAAIDAAMQAQKVGSDG
jgi:hypothetical protein